MKKMIAWVEIPATDFKRALTFYNTILNVEMQAMECGEEKMACFPSGEGAISKSPGFKPSENGPIVNFYAENDIEETLKLIEQNGGKTIQGKTKIEAEGRGYFALFMDCEGNRLGLYGDK